MHLLPPFSALFTRAFSDDDYEVINSRVKLGGGEILVDASLGLLHKLKKDALR